MAPLILLARSTPGFQVEVCTTGQHRDMLDQVLPFFDIWPEHQLQLMQAGQSLAELTAAALSACHQVFERQRPELVLVHGDTSSTLAASLAAFYARIPVAHIEAGLRSGNLQAPWPEEMNRKLTGGIASLHFAPTDQARDNLLREGVPAQSIHVTGNTGIDALQLSRQRLQQDSQLSLQIAQAFPFLDPSRRLLLVTGHRRENFGGGLESICAALRELARRSDVQIVYPVHLNPQVRELVHARLANVENLYLLPPLDYLPFVYLLTRCALVLTDSGGIQEEAPTLGKPVLVLRDITERPEALAAGAARLVGTATRSIVLAASQLLDDDTDYARMAQVRHPFGDGHAASRILDLLRSHREAPAPGSETWPS